VSIDDIAKTAGVLGFVISLATFALTRWERRTLVHFGLAEGTQRVDGDVESYYIDTVDISLINLGGTAVVVNLRVLEVIRGNNVLLPWQQDHWGSQESEVLLPPLGRTVLSVSKDAFEQSLKIESPEKYDKQSFNALLPVQVRVRSTSGKQFRSARLRYWEAIGEFRRV